MLLAAYFRNRQSKSDFVTMPTEKAIRGLIKSGEKFPVPVAAVSNGVDLKNFWPGKIDSETYRRYGLDKKLATVLYVGRVDPEKNVGAVIEAYLKAKEKFANMQMAVVGDGVDRVRLEQKYAEHKDIHFLGRITVPELYKAYRLGDIFVTASEIETQGIVLIEAAATGLPLIAVDKGAVSEVCVSGENGFLCEPGNIDEIAEAMAKILSDDELLDKFSRRSLEIAREHDFEKTLDKFINIYNKVIRSNHEIK